MAAITTTPASPVRVSQVSFSSQTATLVSSCSSPSEDHWAHYDSYCNPLKNLQEEHTSANNPAASLPSTSTLKSFGTSTFVKPPDPAAKKASKSPIRQYLEYLRDGLWLYRVERAMRDTCYPNSLPYEMYEEMRLRLEDISRYVF